MAGWGVSVARQRVAGPARWDVAGGGGGGWSGARQRVAGPQRWEVAGGAGGGWPASVCRAWPSATAFGGCGLLQALAGPPRRKRKWRELAVASRSDGEAELLSRIAGFGVEPYEKLSGQSDADGFLGLSGSGEGLVEFAEVGFMAADQFGEDEQDRSHVGAATEDRAFAFDFSTVVGERRQADELGGLFA